MRIEDIYEEIKDIMFKDVIDIYNRREEIHSKYVRKSLVVKQVYKWYFFCELSLINYEFKSLLWSYINADEMDIEDRVNLSIRYKEFIKRQSKLKREMYLEEQNKRANIR